MEHNITSIRIDDTFADTDKVKALYESAFPPEERAPLDMLTRPEWHGDFRAFYRDGQFCGLAYLLLSMGNCYLFYLAVEENMRGQGIGTTILAQVHELHPDHTVVLEMEELNPEADNYDERLHRAAFYEHCGLLRTGVKNIQCGVTYEVMSTDPTFTLRRYSDMWRDIMRQQGKTREQGEEWLRAIFGDSLLPAE